MKNTFGSDLSLTIFGESHGQAIGAVLDGMAAGVPVDEAFVAACMDKRRARGDGLSTPRTEADAVQFLSGVVNGCTTGTAIALMVENQNTRSADYAKTADLLRPGHADYTAYAKYHGFQDARGGGHFSGRITAALVAGGGIVLEALKRAGIEIVTHIGRCAGVADTPFALTLGARGSDVLHAGGPDRNGSAPITMDGKAVFRFAVDALPRCLHTVLDETGKTLDEVDWVVCHQANSRIIDHCVRALHADPAKFYKNMDRHGNTSAASIPVALNELAETGQLQPGQTIACIGFGGGLTWGGAILQYKE